MKYDKILIEEKVLVEERKIFNDICNTRVKKYTLGFPFLEVSYENFFSDQLEIPIKKMADFLDIHEDLMEIASRVIDISQDHSRSKKRNKNGIT